MQKLGAWQRWGGLAAATSLIALVWLAWLPRIARIPAVARHREAMESKGIHADAMFYTELEWDPPAGFVFFRLPNDQSVSAVADVDSD